MQWSRIKTILIVIFLIVNIYLLVNYLNTSQNGVSVTPSAVDDAVSILEENSIKIDKRIIPTTAPEIRVFDVTNLYATKEDIAEAFLGAGYFKNEQSIFSKDNKTLWVNGSNFDLIVTQDNLPVIPSLKGLSDDNCRKYAMDIIKKLNLGEQYIEITSSTVENGVRIMRFRRIFDEKIVVDTSLSISITESGVCKIEGRNWLGDTIKEGQFISTRTAVEALVKFATNPNIDRTNQIEITNIDECYYLGDRESESKTITAIPVWRITTKDNGIFLYDARNTTLIET